MTVTPGIWKGQTQVNTTDEVRSAQFAGKIVATPDGGYVVVWIDTSNGEVEAEIKGQKYDALGNKVSGEKLIRAVADHQSSLPAEGGQAIADLHNGSLAVAIKDNFNGDNDIYVQLVNSSSLAAGRTDSIDTGSLQTVDPSITSFSNGSYFISYTVENSATNHDILGRFVSASGTIGAPVTIFDSSNQSEASVLATLSNGNAVAVWQAEIAGSSPNIDVKFSIWTPSGTQSRAPSNVSGADAATVIEIDPDVAALAGGGFVVSWTDSDGDTNLAGVRATIYDSAGTAIVSNIAVNTTTTGDQNESSIVALLDGGFVITWEDDGASIVRAQRFDVLGGKVGGEFPVKAGIDDTGLIDSPDSARLTNGRFAYAVEDVSSDYDVLTSIWDPIPPVITSGGGGGTNTVSRTENTSIVTSVTASDATPPLSGFFIYEFGGGADVGLFIMNKLTGELKFNSAPDFEHPTDSDHNNSYVVTVRVSDGSLFDDQTITVNVTNVNEIPVITSIGGGATAAILLPENTVPVTTVTATDPDTGTTLTYSILGGADAAQFQINASTGALAFITAPNFEAPSDSDGNNSYVMQVRASDGSLSDDQVITVSVTNQNEVPAITSNGGGNTAGIAIQENTTAVTTVTASDPDAGASFTYSISGGADAARFQINAATGAVAFIAVPNFEAPSDSDGNNSYVVQVRASDGSLFDDQAITVSITNVNEAPTITSNGGGNTAVVTIQESTTAATTVTATDPDAGTSLAYSIAGGADAARFQINAATGALAFIAAPNFEAPSDSDGNNSYVVQVRASDGSLSDDQVITVNVTDVPEPPGDFNGGGKGDILFQHDNGAIGIWLMDGVTVGQFSGAIPHPGDGWHAREAADFNADGKADILWQHDNGTPAVWRFDGQDPVEFGPALSNPGADWHIVAASDFNADRKADVLFQHDNGAIGVWLMDGVNVGQFSGAIPHPGVGWHARAAADFDGDGKADILWQHDNGTPAVWRFDGQDPIEFGPALSNPGADWHIVAAADFNGDAKSDILFQHDTGAIGIWLMDGVNVGTFSGAIPHPGDGWHAEDATDTNGDGKADIIWQHDNGTPAVWLFDGLDPISFGPALSNPGPEWHIV